MAVALLLLASFPCFAQMGDRQPHIGYIYPAGGRQGTTLQVTIGGQFLRGVTSAYVAGEGVHAKVTRYVEAMRPLNGEQMRELRRRMKERWQGHMVPLTGELPDPTTTGTQPPVLKELRPGQAKKEGIVPYHPMFEALENMSPKEVEYMVREFMDRKKRQLNPQIAELALVQITIDADAVPGVRELRLASPAGLTNPMRFDVGQLPEVLEREPNNPDWSEIQRVEAPVMLNGQITAGDIDQFRFKAKQGQKLVIEVQARRLIPYLADAVPGWFQPTVALYDSKGHETAFADDYKFDPDPVLYYEIPKEDEYKLEIRDALYRGREDFVYRVSVSERPFISGMFPLGGKTGEQAPVWITGYNLPMQWVKLDTKPGPEPIREAELRKQSIPSNPIVFAVNDLPEVYESEANDNAQEAQAVSVPQIVNGYIGRAGDVDMYRFHGKAGETIVGEIYARRLNSPLDSLLRMIDASGKVISWNDDHDDPEMGLLTHQSDSYLSATLPRDGDYFMQVSDTQQHGGSAYAYRLRISLLRPDFALRVTPSSLSVAAGRSIPITVHALRKDGFDGEIEVALKDGVSSFTLSGGKLPRGKDRIRMTLTAGRSVSGEEPVEVSLTGRATINGKPVSHSAIPAEDMMQAFAYRHLVPSHKLLASVKAAKWNPPVIKVSGPSPVRIPAGGTAQVTIQTPMRPMMLRDIQLELNEPPKGISLQNTSIVPGGLAVTLKAAPGVPAIGFADNLILEAFREAPAAAATPTAPAGTPATQKPAARQANKRGGRTSLGMMPAIPIEIVHQ